MQQLSGNPSLKNSLKIAEELACEVTRGKGVINVRHPSWEKPVTVAARRKDTPRALLVELRRLVNDQLGKTPRPEKPAHANGTSSAHKRTEKQPMKSDATTQDEAAMTASVLDSIRAIRPDLLAPSSRILETQNDYPFPPKDWRKPVKVQMVITAEIAKAMLKHNTSNRPLRPGLVARLARAVRQNKWVVTHQGLAFSWEGNMLDGQHRCHAIVEANKALKAEGLPEIAVICEVTYGLDPATYFSMDAGDRRNARDYFEALFRDQHGGKAPTDGNMITAIAASMQAGIKANNGGDRPYSEDSAHYALEQYTLISRFLAAFTKSRDVARGATIAAFCNAAFVYGEKTIMPLAERIGRQLFLTESDPMHALFNRLLKATTSPSRQNRLTRGERYALAVTAIRAGLDGRDTYRLNPAESDFSSDNALDKRILSELKARAKAERAAAKQ